jgi:hypothetical protein
MIVCVCRRVSDHQIRQAVADGAVSLECRSSTRRRHVRSLRRLRVEVLCDAAGALVQAAHAPCR